MLSPDVSAEGFLRNLDTRELPRYSVSEAARYLGLAPTTLRSWFAGTSYGRHPNLHRFEPILTPAAPDLLSFYDVASAHVLMALKVKGVQTEHIRDVVDSLKIEFPGLRYPLLGKDFWLFGKDVVIKRLGTLMNLSRSRQLGLKGVMERFLSRLDLDCDKMPLRFSPLRVPGRRGGGLITIDPAHSGGRPVIRGTGIAAEVIANRRMSGESISSLARDYRLSTRAIEEAVEYFQTTTAA